MSLAKSEHTGWPPTVLARWEFITTGASATTVLPDGCSDLILHVTASGETGCQVSALADAAMHVPGCAGEWWLGFRLQPGTTIDTGALLKSVHAIWTPPGQVRGQCGPSAQQEAALMLAIDAHTRLDPCVQEALNTLAHARSVGKAAQSLGVSERSLERLTRRATA